MAVTLALGPITFADFEIPSEVPFGGAQALVVKKLVGGDRVIDAMGPDEADIGWSGRFRGPLAEVRARQLDLIRKQGQQQLLSWSSLRYLVVVDKFQARFEAPFEVPYSISCVVLQDLSVPVLPAQPDVDSLIFGDVNGAGGLASQINVPAIITAVASVASAANAVAKFSGAPAAEVAGVQSSIQTALVAVQTQQTVGNATVAPAGSVAGVTAGNTGLALAQSLSSQSATMGQLAQLYQLQASLQRASINVSNAGS